MKGTIFALAVLVALACPAGAGEKQKKFTILVDPPDATIKVISGNDLEEKLYKSPATIIASVPRDQDLARKATVQITRDKHKPTTISLATIREGDVLNIKLEKIFRTCLKFRMAGPVPSDEIRIKDALISIALRLDDQHMEMNLTNNSSRIVRILWQRAVYTDPDNQSHRIMHPGIRFEDRNGSFPYQTVKPYITLHQAVIPVDNVVFNPQKKSFEVRPLFRETAESMNGKELAVLIPIDIGEKIVPYTFKIKMAVVRE